MSDVLQPRTGPLAWAHQSAQGGTDGLGWVDSSLVERGRSFVVAGTDEHGGLRFRHAPYGAFLPPPMLSAAQEAQAQGVPTALEGLVLLFARCEWLIATRGLLWTTATPLPEILAPLVEAYGIEGELHRADPSVLVTLLAHLPRWYPHRGDPLQAVALLEAALDETPSVDVVDDPARDEVLACHGARWWAERGVPTAAPVIRGGAARIPASAPRRLRTEDVVLGWTTRTERIPHELLRLLPAWASVRLTAERVR